MRERIFDEIDMPRLRNRLAAKLRAAVRHQFEIGLEVTAVAGVGAVVASVVLGAEHQHDDVRLDALPQAPQQQILLIRSVSGNAAVDDAKPRQLAAHPLGETVVGFDVVAPHEGIAEEQDGLRARATGLDVAQAETVVRNAGRAHSGVLPDRVGNRQPAELCIIGVGQAIAGLALAQIAQIDDAQDRFARRQRDNDQCELDGNRPQHTAPSLQLRFGTFRSHALHRRRRPGLLERVGARECIVLRASLDDALERRKRREIDLEEIRASRLARKADVGDGDRIAVGIAAGRLVLEMGLKRGERGAVPVLRPFRDAGFIELEFMREVLANARHDQRMGIGGDNLGEPRTRRGPWDPSAAAADWGGSRRDIR